MTMLDEASLRLLWLDAHTHNGWLNEPVSDELLHRLWDVLRLAPTSANLSPGRVVFVKSAAAKEKLRPAMAPGNLEKTMAAPVTAIMAYDLKFYEFAPKLMPHRDMKSAFAAMPEAAVERQALMNGSLQGGYFILAARALGLDCGPMAGFDAAKVDEAFFAGTSWRSNFLVNLGHGDVSKVRPRAPRLEFAEACRIE